MAIIYKEKERTVIILEGNNTRFNNVHLLFWLGGSPHEREDNIVTNKMPHKVLTLSTSGHVRSALEQTCQYLLCVWQRKK